MAKTAFTGRSVGLRELREEDLAQLTAWWNDPDTAARQVTGPMQARPAADVAAMFRMWSGNGGSDVGMSVVALDSGELVGHVTLYGAEVKDRCATLAIIIGPPHQGRGLGTDAVRVLVDYGFTELGLHRIQLTVNGDNPAAIAAYRKAGFVEEGRRREAFYRGGRWIDHVQMGILAGEQREEREQREQRAHGTRNAAASLRIELFAADLDNFVDFYTRVLGFALLADQRGDDGARSYVAVSLGSVRIGAVPPWAGVDRSARSVPTGAEIVLEVEDVEAAHRRVADSGWPLADGLTPRPWGLTDFRVHDPDGYYLRVTSR